ncbi:MAG: hypothetical protein K2N72_07225 [Oscillospiraceae bacterium]|nr:hypothetical protein [Oscillospiraceae bacterium]
MNIKVNVKQIGAKRDKISGEDFFIRGVPHTVGELITEAVRTCVEAYNSRVKKGDSAEPITDEDIRDMADVGKIAFGINYSQNEADEKTAAENALQAYEDGLFRIFIGEREAGELSDSISLSENDSVTFIKLTMLSGSMW